MYACVTKLNRRLARSVSGAPRPGSLQSDPSSCPARAGGYKDEGSLSRVTVRGLLAKPHCGDGTIYLPGGKTRE